MSGRLANRFGRIAALVCVTSWLLAPGVSTCLAIDGTGQWHQWRGPHANGSVADADPPIQWGPDTNIQWQVELPGEGNATPIIWGDRIFIAAAIETGLTAASKPASEAPAAGRQDPALPTHVYEFALLAFDRHTGAELWRTVLAKATPHEPGHETNSFASSSPVTDGRHVYMSFGSRGIFCLDTDGRVVWQRDLGQMQTRGGFGEGASASLHGNTLVVPWDHEGQSFVIALDARTGDTQWQVDRDEQTTWATPLIVESNGRTQVVLNGHRVRSYDLETGGLLWECGGQVYNPIPSPVAVGDAVVCMTGFRGNAIFSIPLQARGDISGTDAIRWHRNDAAPYVPSPVLYKGRLYFTKSNNGIVSSVDARTGEVVIKQQRLPGISSVYASPVAAADRIYFTGRDGTTTVIRHGDELEVLSINRLGEGIDASPAIVGDAIYLRTHGHLICIARGAESG